MRNLGGIFGEQAVKINAFLDAHPVAAERFEDCLRQPEEKRFLHLRREAADAKRPIWEDHGVPEGHRETFGDHSGEMKALLDRYDAPKGVDIDTVATMCTVDNVIKYLLNEDAYERTPFLKRRELEVISASMVFNATGLRKYSGLMQEINGKTDVNNRPSKESLYRGDLDNLITARRARVIQMEFPAAKYPELHETMGRLYKQCQDSLVFDESKNLFHKITNEFPGSRTQPAAQPVEPKVPAVAEERGQVVRLNLA